MVKFPTTLNHQEKLRLANALFLVNGQPETQEFIGWLNDEMARLDRDNRQEPEEVVYRQRQGALQTIESLLKIMEQADETYRKLKQNEREGLI